MRNLAFGSVGLLAIAIVAGSCSGSSSVMGGGSQHGNVRFVLSGGSEATGGGGATATAPSDGSGRRIQSAAISLTSILARNLDGQLIDVTIALPVDVDLVALMNGGTTDLPAGALPAGSYDQLVVVIRSLHIVLTDGTQIDVTPPGGGWTSIVRTGPFDVVDGQVTTVELRFRAGDSFRWVDGRLEFDPSFDCSVNRGGGN
jgi:hypothetical protein